jgi:uncharacterized integral membrane protein
MRSVQGALLLAFLGVVGIFAVQNRQAISVAFLGMSLTAPLAILVLGVYVLGMLTGWTVVAFLRRSIHGVRSRTD